MSYEIITITEDLGYEDPNDLANEYETYFDMHSTFDADDYEYQQDLASGLFS